MNTKRVEKQWGINCKENKLKWFEHVMEIDDSETVRCVIELNVKG